MFSAPERSDHHWSERRVRFVPTLPWYPVLCRCAAVRSGTVARGDAAGVRAPVIHLVYTVHCAQTVLRVVRCWCDERSLSRSVRAVHVM